MRASSLPWRDDRQTGVNHQSQLSIRSTVCASACVFVCAMGPGRQEGNTQLVGGEKTTHYMRQVGLVSTRLVQQSQ